MFKKILLLSFIILFGFTPKNCLAKYSGGDGSPGNPYRINDANDMNNIGLDSNDWDKHFLMTADINMADYTYTTALISPDTDNTDWHFVGVPFTGTFDGNNYTIHNFSLDATGTNNNYYLGLFGQLRLGAVISNLYLENMSLKGGTSYIGGLCGANGDCDRQYDVCGSNADCDNLEYNGGTIDNCYFSGIVTSENNSFAAGGLTGANCFGSIQNCHVEGTVNGDDYFGGMVGWNWYGTISNCYTNTRVVGRDDSYAVGGLVGYNQYGDVNNCHSNGEVTGGINSYAIGGMVGDNDEGSIIDCYATGTVNAEDTIGNLVGRNSYGTISRCYSAGMVTGFIKNIGGFVGYNYGGDIINCYASDTVVGEDNSYQLGGLVGWNYGTIINCYAVGSVTGGIGSYYLGGLAGRNNRTITNCYAAGDVNCHNPNTGGLVGYDNSGTYTKSFWDKDVNPDVNGIGNTTDPNVIGKSTAEMQTESTYTSAGWDFVGETVNGPNDIWTIHDTVDYPKLVWPLVNFVGWYEVDLADYAFFSNYWKDTNCGDANDCNGVDLDFSDTVDGKDLKILFDKWLTGLQ